MIYEFPGKTDDIKQGDIFFGLPRVEISMKKMLVFSEDGNLEEMEWKTIAAKKEGVTALFGVKPVIAIVATQNCDVSHSRDITLCEIRPFAEVEGKAKQASSPKSLKNIITQHARINQKWFYLPPDSRLGFTEKMAVDFRVTLRLSRTEIEDYRDLRKGRLNSLADEHFRERIAEFFRRYAYDEWYPLNLEELKIYKSEYPEIQPFPWQEDPAKE
jgi:hypothetical protein